jgi:phosphoglycolate phosphatase-like HAD superfamily hydrolase
MSGQKYVCIDLDSTIAHYDEWHGEEHFGEPVSGVQAALLQIQSAGWKIIIYTTRANKELVGGFLKSHSIPFDHINENPEQPEDAKGGKPFADAYIDDRGIQFNGDWQSTVNELFQFVPWEKRKTTGITRN